LPFQTGNILNNRYRIVLFLGIQTAFILGLQARNSLRPAPSSTPILFAASVETSSVVDAAPTMPAEALKYSPESTFKPTSTLVDTRVPSVTHTPSVTTAPLPSTSYLLGYSTKLNPIEVYKFGNGPEQMVFIGGIHGGYEWNTILLAYRVIDYFSENIDQVPARVSLYIVPVANPDGQVWVV